MKNGRVLLTLALGTVFTCANACAETPAPRARLLHVEGTVETRSPGEAEWKTPQKGAWIAQGTAIKTAAAAGCDIGLGEKRRSVVHMKENTRITVDTLDAEKIKVKLELGRVLVWVRDLPRSSTFQVTSPTAIASTRGTGWEQGLENIQVFEETVEVADMEGESMLVEEGSGVDFTPEGLGEVFEVSDEAKAEWGSFQEEAEKHVAEEPAAGEPTPSEEKPAEAPEEKAPETENLFDSFNEGFESPEQEAAEEGTEAMTEAQEESEESEPPADLEDDEHDRDCNVYPYC